MVDEHCTNKARTNKSDYIDVQAIAEAVVRSRMRFVPIKTNDQLDMQPLHRVQERWVMLRTAIVNQVFAACCWSAASRCIRDDSMWTEPQPDIGRYHGEVIWPIVPAAVPSKDGAGEQLALRIGKADAAIEKTAQENEACRRWLPSLASD